MKETYDLGNNVVLVFENDGGFSINSKVVLFQYREGRGFVTLDLPSLHQFIYRVKLHFVGEFKDDDQFPFNKPEE